MTANDRQLQDLFRETLEELAKIPNGTHFYQDTALPWYSRLFGRNKSAIEVRHDIDGCIHLAIYTNRNSIQGRAIVIKRTERGFYELRHFFIKGARLAWSHCKGDVYVLADGLCFSAYILKKYNSIKKKDIHA